MGKHERELIKQAEIIVVKLLNKETISENERKNPWFKHAFALAEQIRKDFPKLNFTEHLGNRYDNTGDILIKVGDKNLYLELKMSETKKGTGTKANISQNALTENQLFNGTVKSWSEFREENGHADYVNSQLDSFKYYPEDITEITSDNEEKDTKARFLRDSEKQKGKTDKDIMHNIHEFDKKIKIAYLDYLSRQEQNSEMIRRFYILIELGVHRKEELRKIIEKSEIISQVENLVIYYSNSEHNNITVRKEDVGEKIKTTLEGVQKIKIIFPKGLTQCKIIGLRNNHEEVTLLSVVLHWKNIAQGIKTPCLNIFD